MKKILLLIIMCVPAVLVAQNGNGVTVKELAIQSGMVTFEVSWDRDKVPAVWSDSVWVFVDYNNNGVMERLPLSAGATLTATSAEGVGKVIEEPGNNQGVWVVGNARTQGSFSATVKLLTEITGIGGACVYASNYPPVGVFVNEDGISFTGTPAYNLVVDDGQGNLQDLLTPGSSFTMPGSFTLVSFSDKTGAPGKIIPHAVYCLPDPGVIGGSSDTDPSCASYIAGNIGGADDVLPSCAAYVPGAIGGSDDVSPSCASYRAGSIGGVSFVSANCEDYVAGIVGGSGDMDPGCASYMAGNIGGSDDAPPSCATYRAGSIGGRDDVSPSCAGYRAGSIGGVSFVSANCEGYVAGVIGGSGDMAPGCASYVPGNIGGSDDALPSCAAYRAGSIGGRDDVSPSCASYRAGSIGGVSFAGLM
jgi:hypothetical protein